jgi:hypothetical protein
MILSAPADSVLVRLDELVVRIFLSRGQRVWRFHFSLSKMITVFYASTFIKVTQG